MIQEYIKALFLILMAEMGDKTQILALAFATQFRVFEVLFGVFTGSLLNHGLAVVLGAYLSTLIPIQSMQILAGFLFIGFALWTLKIDEEEEEHTSRNRGPILTVALAFFIGELGDKTQLTAITLSADAGYPFAILLGTVTGMVLVSAMGIYIGSKIGKSIPEVGVKIASAIIFMFFGLSRLYQTLPNIYLRPMSVLGFTVIVIALIIVRARPLLRTIREGKRTALQEAAYSLYQYKQQIKGSVDAICLGEEKCGNCQDLACIIGYSKYILRRVVEEQEVNSVAYDDFKESLKKTFNKNKVITSLAYMIHYLSTEDKNKDTEAIHQARQLLERILINEEIHWHNLTSYKKVLHKKDKKVGRALDVQLTRIRHYFIVENQDRG